MNKKILYGIVTFLSVFFAANQAFSDTQYQIERVFSSVSFVYMAGHNGDPNWIEGFDYSGEIYLNGSQIGTFTGQGTLFNPPLDITERYDAGLIRITNTITNKGSFETVGQFLSMGTSTSAVTGNATLVWLGSISNGTGIYDGMVGLNSGVGNVNVYSTQGSGTEILLLRFGY